MNMIKKVFLVVCSIFMLESCALLRLPVIVRNAPMETFKYVYIYPTKELISGSVGTYSGQYGIYGTSTTKSVNLSDVIAGALIKGRIYNIA